ncbi:LamG domain-containing protein [Candidatus Omnitrophota bacterium]
MNIKRLILITLLIIALLPVTTYAASKGDPPVAHWRFDEAGGDYTYDDMNVSPTNRGTLTPGATAPNTAAGHMWDPQGKIGGAMDFDGDDYVEVPDSDDFSFAVGNPFSVSAWVYISASPDDYDAVVGKWNNDAAGTREWLFRFGVGDTWEFRLCNGDDSGSRGRSTTDTIPTGKWTHIVGTTDGTASPNAGTKIYINGVQKDTTNISSGSYDGMNPSSSKLFMGAVDATAISSYFNGKIDDVRIYDYIRTPAQIMVDYNAGAASYLGAGTDPNEGNPPVGWWQFDENAGTDAYDRSGNNNNGTITNATWAAGKYGNALSFDGSGDYVALGTSLLNSQSAQTISAWIYINSLPTSTDYWKFPTIVHKGNVYINFGYNNNGKLIGYYYNSSSQPVTSINSSSSMTTGKWYHVAWTWTATVTKLYIDGQEEYSGTNIGPGYNLNSAHANGDVRIGLSPAASSQGVNGLIDDLKIYSYTRTQAQIAYDYNKGKPVAHWKFDEGGGPIAHDEYCTAGSGAAPVAWHRMDNDWNDESGNGNNLTTGGDPTFSSSSKIGPYCGDFDGTGDYVRITDGQSIFGGKSTITVEFWIKPAASQSSIHYIEYGIGNSTFSLESGVPTALFYINNSNQGSITFTADAWQHIALVMDGTKSYRYKNGALVGSNAFTSAISDVSSAFDIGGRAGARNIEALFDDFRIYDYARTAAQIAEDYKSTHGTLVADTKFVDGKLGKALTFDGTGDYMEVADNDIFSIGNGTVDSPFSISLWMKAGSLVQYDGVVQKWDNNNQREWLFRFGDSATGENWEFRLFDESADVTRGRKTGVFLTTGQWYHLVGTYNGDESDPNAGIDIYVDGVVSDTADIDTAGTYTAMENKTGKLFFGALEDTGAAPYRLFDGIIDDVRIYNYTLTAAQVMEDYNAGSPARLGAPSAYETDPWDGAAPVGWWQLDENSGMKAYDNSGNGNDGTITGATWAQGKVGPCLSFDGTSDTISVPNVNNSYPFTVCLWATHNTDWNPAGSATMDEMFNMSIASQRVSLGIGDNWDSNGEIHIMYGGTNHWGAPKPSASGSTDWNHIAWVVYGSDNSNHKIYVNGVSQTMTDRGGAHGGTAGWNIGSNSASGEWWDGKIDDVKIYNYTRTQAQVAWDYNRGKPMAHWKMDEAVSGSAVGTGNIKDESVHNNDGDGSGSNIAWTTGKFGGALDFDGSTDFVRSSPLATTDSTAFSASFWVKFNSLTNTYNGTVARQISGSPTAAGWVAANYNNGAIYIFARSGSTDFCNQSTGFVPNTTDWYHFTTTWDSTGDGKVRFYLNGNLYYTSTTSSTTTMTGLPSRVLMGSLQWANTSQDSIVSSQALDGMLDDVRIYNYPRTAEQVMQDYNEGAATHLSE